jgi:hypothetical protein
MRLRIPRGGRDVDAGNRLSHRIDAVLPKRISGVVFFAGIAISDWRHAVVALIGSFVAVAPAEHAGALGGAINSGFVGFNGVLAALAAYVIVAPDLRLVVFAAIAATWLASCVYRGVPFRSWPPASCCQSGQYCCSRGSTLTSTHRIIPDEVKVPEIGLAGHEAV